MAAPRSVVGCFAAAVVVGAPLVGCAAGGEVAAPPMSTVSAAVAPPAVAVLPPPEALTDVLYRLADPRTPGGQKLGLVDDAGPADVPGIDGFARALRDSGLDPVGFTADAITWSDLTAGDVTADVTVHSGGPGLGPAGFSLPMDFTAHPTGWRLTRATAELLLTVGDTDAAAPPR